MPRQMIFEWAHEAPPALDNFLVGVNAEIVAHLRALAGGKLDESSVLIWGGPGAGKSHLLTATLAAAAAAGRPESLLTTEGAAPFSIATGGLYAVDDVDRLTPAAQGRLFTLYNTCRDAGAQLLLAARVAPAQAPLRDDVRTRAGWGLVLELKPLTDAEKPDALSAYARAQGFRLSRDVIEFLLTRRQRDMAALLATLRALDRYSLSTKRQITIPLVKELLQPELSLGNGALRSTDSGIA
ncbi:MAG: DnaA regulatory inactivator Hda [Betaproteobacteria bacterium]